MERMTEKVIRIEGIDPAELYGVAGSNIDRIGGKRGDRHDFRTGIALETQNFPDAPNHDNFPSAVLRPGETYTQTSVYAFEMNKEGRSYVRNRRKTQDKTIGHE